ncbi:hypothetical protein [Dysosmobacter sp.]|uniref:hypothetical protein n=1 Tax=Dysosmobacter sp. TaxID=2591382 RepID=UPI00262F0DD0|nr:hypothetical protein [Dysosmobacter sp.]
MTLLTTVFAAVFCTVLWYQKASARELKVGILCWMFWGASLMWLGDAIFEYAELGAAYFTPAASDMLNDLFLGLSVIALALVIWLVIVLIKDPKGVVRAQLFKKA